MRYADAVCTYSETSNPHEYVFTGSCIECKQAIVVKIPAKELYVYRQGAKIQSAMPSVSANDREFLMTGICGTCFDKIFADTGEDENDTNG